MLATASVAATESDETPVRIRYGFMVATERCAACHIASLHQTLKPLYDTPKFEDIANRPTTTRETLVNFLGTAHGTNLAPSNAPLPRGAALSPLTDREKSDVAFYILSLRNKH
jgi:hypothetical protein